MAKKENAPMNDEQFEAAIDAGKAARKARNVEKRKAKRQALVDMINFINSVEAPAEVVAAAKLLTPGNRATSAAAPSKLDQFAGLFTENNRVSEEDLFMQYKVGRAEMRKICTNLIKKRKPEDRIWVRLDVPSETYMVEGYGPDAPAGWAGYKPVEIGDQEIL